jgi:serine/threonine-protein kinase 11
MKPTMISDLQSKPRIKLNQYLLAARISRGTTGKVYLAIDTEANRKFAAKSIQLNRAHSSCPILLLEREIRFMRKLDHPNLIRLHEVVHRQDTNTVYLVMEYASAGTLAGRALSEGDAAAIFRQVLRGLIYLHGQGFVHQDIKPSNILLFEDGRVKLGDFGIVHSFESAETVVGSPAYQAPEFFDDNRPQIDPTMEDVWSFGVAMYEAVFHRLPFNGGNMFEIAADAERRTLELPETASANLRDLLQHILCREPASRYSLKDIAEHPFFEGAEMARLHFPARQLKMKQSPGLMQIKAHVCSAEYSFSSLSRSRSLRQTPKLVIE